MEIYENKTVLYEFTEEEATLHYDMLASVYKYLVKAGYKTFHLTSDQFDHLKIYIEKFEQEPAQEIIIQAERSTIESDFIDPTDAKKRKKKR